MEKVKERTGIYHEHQDGYLCGQHALNNLLQNAMFSADALADIARTLDVEEISVLEHTPFESENMDDTGFFNIQVLQRALKIFEIELIPYASQDSIAKEARASPESIQAYICNLGLHWFTIRQFGRQYFDLNSFYYVPELISNMMLLTYLNLIQEKGYSVFIVHGTLPQCIADQQLTANPIHRTEYRLLTEGLPKFIRDKHFKGNIKNLDKYGNPVVTLPRYLYEEFRKNPNNPDIKQKINTFLPEGVSFEDVLKLTGTSGSDIDGQLFGGCNCPRHRPHPQVSTEPLAPRMMNDSFTDDPNKQQQSRAITRHMTQYINEEPNLDDHGVQNMTQASIGLQNAEDDLLRHVIARSLLNTSEMNDDKDPIAKLDQRLLDEAIAASLTTDDSVLKQFEEAPKSIPIITMNSEPISTKNPSSPPSKDTYSSPPIDTHPLPPENNNSPSPTDTHSPSPKMMNSSPPKDTCSVPPVIVDPDYKVSPSIEELRQRRLQMNGNRNRSIISQVSNFND